MIIVFELIGTIAFAISGASLATEKKMDIFGVAILGMTTAVGGGIIRDLILGVAPPAAFQQPLYGLLAIAVSIVVFLPKVRQFAQKPGNPFLLVMDSVGLAVFTVIGVQAGMLCANRYTAVFVGVVTGVGGGVLRDLFAGNLPSIFVRHFYATASLIGALLAIFLWPEGEHMAMTCGAVTVLVLRLLAAKYRWSLPKA